MTKILLVEDDIQIAKNLKEYLTGEGYQVILTGGQKEALEQMEVTVPDLVLLDVSLPDGNGYAVCTAIKMNYEVPVIFVSASGDEFSVVTGLDMGADDYISKPFRPRELLSRVKSVLRRNGKTQAVLEVGDIRVDTVKGTVTRDGNDLYLSALEYRLFLNFITNRGVILSRNQLLSDIWDIAGDYVNDNTLTVYIKRLREKVEQEPQNPTIIKTVRGLGYRMEG